MKVKLIRMRSGATNVFVNDVELCCVRNIEFDHATPREGKTGVLVEFDADSVEFIRDEHVAPPAPPAPPKPPAPPLNDLALLCHARAREAGWWEPYYRAWANNERDATITFRGTCYSLMHSELSEAFEGLRKGGMDKHLPHRTAESVELADLLIRVFDYAGHCGFDLDGAVREKLEYNRTRHDHKPEVRAAEGGKKF